MLQTPCIHHGVRHDFDRRKQINRSVPRQRRDAALERIRGADFFCFDADDRSDAVIRDTSAQDRSMAPAPVATNPLRRHGKWIALAVAIALPVFLIVGWMSSDRSVCGASPGLIYLGHKGTKRKKAGQTAL